jgi:pimeloyl-ACP methyl ester carboxylesterase
LDAGGADFSTAWALVQPEIAKFARVCSYDRAGYGFSDPSNRPATASNIVEDLHDALKAAGIEPPLVLVGHSAGGLYATLYADRYLSEVAGLVLVDPGVATQGARMTKVWEAHPAELSKERASKAQFLALLKKYANAARSGDRAALPREYPCPRAPATQVEFIAYLTEYCAQPNHYEAMLAEDAALLGPPGGGTSQAEAEELAAARQFGSRPLVVLSQSRGFDYGGPQRAQLSAELNSVWRATHAEIALRSTRGKMVIVPNSGHSIQSDQPQAVIDAVREVVTAARADQR